MTVTIPALPNIINQITIFHRIGWFTTDSASFVVNPVPENADYAWNLALFLSNPVIIKAMAAPRTIKNEIKIVSRVGSMKYKPRIS